MRITSWAIVFVMIIFSFSFANRMLVNNKMEIVKEEVKYNNAIDLATMDATRDMMENMINLGTGNRESFYSVLSSVDTFFESFGLTLGYYGGDEKQTALKTYIPVVAVLANEGFYICSLEDLQKREGANTIYYKEHALKPRIPYSVEDKTPLLARLNGTEKVRYPAEGVYINYTMGNEIKIYDSKKNKKMIEGVIVDTRHYKDLMETEEYKPVIIEEVLPDGTKVNFTCMYSNDVYSKEGTYKGNAIYYEKSFYKVNNIRYLYEEWYINDVLVDKRTTEYTEEAYNFTKSIENLGIELGTNDSYYSLAGNYLTQGNPENTGSIDPFTGIYTIGEFHRIKNEAITNIVKEKLASYIVLHNRYLQMNNITYTFSLPNISTQDWSRAISDVSVFAFVQGIPMLGETYYNNYGLSGAQIVERNVFYAYPGLRPDLSTGTVSPTSTEFPTYYSNYDFSPDAKYLLEANGARIYYTAQAAAMAGYFPNIHSNDLVAQLDIDINTMDVKLEYRGPTRIGQVHNKDNQIAVFGVTGTTTYGPIVLTYEISPRLNEPVYLQQASYMHSKYSSMNYTKNRILNGGTAIGLNSYNSNTRVGTFLVDQNGTYVMAIREFGGITERSNKVSNLYVIEGINFTIKAKSITYTRDSNGKRHGVVVIEGNDTPIFSKVEWVKKDARDYVGSMSTVNSATPTAILHIYKDGVYTIQATNGFGDRMATTDVTIKIPNIKPTVYIERTPNTNTIYKTENVAMKATAYDADGDPMWYKWEHSTDGGTTWTTLSNTTNTLETKKYPTGTHHFRVTVWDEYEGVNTATTSFTVPNRAPTVTIERTPSASTIYKNQVVSIKAVANDVDQDVLTYKWEYSTNGTSWTTMSTTTAALPNKKYTTGKHYFRVTVTDIDGATATASTSFTVPNRAPTVIIERMSPSMTIYKNELVEIKAVANDVDQDVLTYKWEHSTNGTSWTTMSTTTAQLPTQTYAVGAHYIRVTVKDIDGATATASTSFTVINKNLSTVSTWTTGSGFNIHGTVKTTYADAGYKVFMKVNGSQTSAPNGKVYNGVKITYDIKYSTQRNFTIVTFHVTNQTNTAKTVGVAVGADIMIGGNDRAPIKKLPNDTGFEMWDGNNKFYVYLKNSPSYGVTNVSTYWFGHYSSYPSNLWNNVGTSSISGIDSGMAFSWKDKTLPANGTLSFTFVMGM